MTRLIDADKLKEEFDQDDWGNYLDSEVRQIIDNAPTVVVGYLKNCTNCDSGYAQGYSDGYLKGKEERPQGKWEYKTITDDYRVYGRCSNCLQRKRIDNYCPNCGAKMDKEA